MTPKEKAMELFQKYWKYLDIKLVKKCALIAVDEILNNDYPQFEFESDLEYWKEVRKEIKKI